MQLNMKQIKDFQVPPKSLAIWYLGQAGFIIKSPANVIAALDPYLSNSCKIPGETMGLNFDRLFAPLLQPEELVDIDLYLLTHSHQDHLDPVTVKAYQENGGRGPYVAPAEAVEKLQEIGIPAGQMTMIWPNKTYQKNDLFVRAMIAIPFGGDDLTHVGYLIYAEGSPMFYFTGDTDYHEILANSLSEHKPDVLVTVINGAFRNLSPSQAALLAKQINPEVVIPCHYDLFPDNQILPVLLKTNLMLYNMQDKYKVLEYGKPFCFPCPSFSED